MNSQNSIERRQAEQCPAIPPPTRPDGTPFPTLVSLFRAVIFVPKTEIDKREEKWKRAQKKKQVRTDRINYNRHK